MPKKSENTAPDDNNDIDNDIARNGLTADAESLSPVLSDEYIINLMIQDVTEINEGMSREEALSELIACYRIHIGNEAQTEEDILKFMADEHRAYLTQSSDLGGDNRIDFLISKVKCHTQSLKDGRFICSVMLDDFVLAEGFSDDVFAHVPIHENGTKSALAEQNALGIAMENLYKFEQYCDMIDKNPNLSRVSKIPSQAILLDDNAHNIPFEGAVITISKGKNHYNIETDKGMLPANIGDLLVRLETGEILLQEVA